jgi:hypothetical protein
MLEAHIPVAAEQTEVVAVAVTLLVLEVAVVLMLFGQIFLMQLMA